MQELAQYGPMGAVLAVVLGPLLWAFRRLLNSLLHQQELATTRNLEKLEAIRAELQLMRETLTDLGTTVAATAELRRAAAEVVASRR